MNTKVLLYSAPMCGDCQHLKAFLEKRGVSYEMRDIKAEPEYARELEKATGKQGVPYLVVNGEWVRGYRPGEPFSEAFAEKILGLS